MSRRNDLGARKKSLQEINYPATLVVALSEIKNSLRLDASQTDDDVLLTALIQAATRNLENLYGVRMLQQTLELSLDDLPFRKLSEPALAYGEAQLGFHPTRPMSEIRVTEETIDLLVTPVQSITSFKYFDDQNNEITWDSGNYYLDEASKPARLTRKADIPWPVDLFRSSSSVKIRFVAGYADAASVPPEMKMAVQQLAEFYYMNRGCSDAKSMPLAVDALMIPWRRVRI